MKQKKIILIISIGFITLFSIIIITFFLTSVKGMTVNGLSVTREEYELLAEKNRAIVSTYFYNTYGAQTDNNNFWNMEFEGEIPVEVLKKRTINDIVRVKCVQQLAKKYKLEFPQSFDKFKQQRETANEKRKAAKEQGGTIYGPVEFGLHEYYLYIYGKLEDSLKEKLRKEYFDFSDDELKSYFKSLDKKYFHKGYQGLVQLYYTDSKYYIYNSDGVLAMLNEVIWYLKENKDVSVNELSERYKIPLYEAKQEIRKGIMSKEDDMLLQVVEVFSGLEPGEVSSMVKFGWFTGIIQSLSKKDFGYSDFEENRELVTRKYLDKKYEELILEMVLKAKVKRAYYGKP